ncbi:uncharacterized protein FOMMEDRAFT_136194 [Fomitiporia mediterranea MF3/22]|uniref:uncharacterized protein n=1 Tax=Fomitiporia mediterranea (strain MF3/22) TaxID=694068 RepID=UPI00044080AF|nr:uncharacterized protein FOMMEDRAFT_136194 [Fomitiporia mediterranea MF3/22]EJD00072.1 hypothetical protein FOMMEDRAFT_136194 [Fomitiporia mediterranea MF3/22]
MHRSATTSSELLENVKAFSGLRFAYLYVRRLGLLNVAQHPPAALVRVFHDLKAMRSATIGLICTDVFNPWRPNLDKSRTDFARESLEDKSMWYGNMYMIIYTNCVNDKLLFELAKNSGIHTMHPFYDLPSMLAIPDPSSRH